MPFLGASPFVGKQQYCSIAVKVFLHRVLLMHSPECISILWRCFIWCVPGLILSLEYLQGRELMITPRVGLWLSQGLSEVHVSCLNGACSTAVRNLRNPRGDIFLTAFYSTVIGVLCLETCTQKGNVAPATAACARGF